MRVSGRRSIIARPVAASLLLVTALLACGGDEGGGVHAKFGWSSASGLRVVDVPEGPALDAGLREGDRIVAIDGVSIEDLPLREIVHRLRGEVGTHVALDVVRDGARRRIQIRRAAYE